MGPEATQQIYIVQEPGICGGQPRIAGTRLKVQHIAVEYEYMGWSPDQICSEHPGLTLSQVHAALAFYYEHKAEIDAKIRADEEFADQMRKNLNRTA